MAKERKKREKRKSSVDLSRAIKLGTEYSSEGARRYGLGKKIHKESEDLQGEISREQEKAEHKSLWSSVGLALGSLAAGIATGGANWYVQAAAVATGAIGGGVIGREASEFTKGEMKDIKSKDYLFYRKEAEKQKDAYAGFDKELRDSILSRGLAAGALAGAVAGGGEILSKMKTAEMTKAAQAAEIAKAQKVPISPYNGDDRRFKNIMCGADQAMERYKTFLKKEFPNAKSKQTKRQSV